MCNTGVKMYQSIAILLDESEMCAGELVKLFTMIKIDFVYSNS